MKSILLGFGLMVVSTVQSVAQETHASFVGPSVSVGISLQGTDIFDANVSTTNNSNSFDQPDASGDRLNAQIHAGYGFDFGNRFNASVNLFYDFGKATVEDTNATFFGDPVVQDIDNRFGAYIAPGVYLGQSTLIYAKFGVTMAEQSYTRPNTNIAVDAQVNGTLYGFGAKHMLENNMFLAMDYTKSEYGSARIGEAVNLNGFSVNIRSEVEQEDISIRIGYQF
jgi:opacity protein-like surface antigen